MSTDLLKTGNMENAQKSAGSRGRDITEGRCRRASTVSSLRTDACKGTLQCCGQGLTLQEARWEPKV